jgi:hypothetical protein
MWLASQVTNEETSAPLRVLLFFSSLDLLVPISCKEVELVRLGSFSNGVPRVFVIMENSKRGPGSIEKGRPHKRQKSQKDLKIIDVENLAESKPNGVREPQSTSNSISIAPPKSVANGGQDGKAKTTGWRVSKPLGGRMADIDPILAFNDK